MLKMSQVMQGSNTQWSVSSLVHLVQEKKAAAERLWLDPPFQRGSVWTLEQKQRLIESFLDELPVPPIAMEQVWNWSTEQQALVPGHEWCYMVIDGRQRCEALLGFVDGTFAVRGEYFRDQPEAFQRHFGNSSLAVITTRLGSLRACADLYVRLLTTGTAHTPAEIEAAQQFIRGLPSAKSQA